MIAAPEMAPGVVTAPVSTIDICPTLCNLAGISMAEVMPWTHGESLVPLASGGARRQAVAMEYAAEASYAPLVSLCSGWWKYIRCALDPEQLFNLETDPHELCNLASNPQYAKILQDLRDQSHALWDLDRFDAEIRESQARRWVIYEALREGGYYPWDYQPLQKASERYMRNHMDLNALEAKKRVPKRT
jgi:choline-sulfatase